jgi:hypothetical protein
MPAPTQIAKTGSSRRTTAATRREVPAVPATGLPRSSTGALHSQRKVPMPSDHSGTVLARHTL